MSAPDFVDSTRSEGRTILEVAALGLAAPVPSCPGWVLGTLVRHVGLVHRWVTEILTTRAQARIPFESLARPLRAELLTWFEQGLSELESSLLAAEADPSAPVWNWSSAPQVAGFWPRRMAHETAVHRWDAEAAHGRSRPIEAALAADGIDEVLDVFVPSALSDAAAEGPRDVGSMVLERTDGPGSWRVEVVGGKLQVVRDGAGAGPPDVALRGGASDLLLVMWGREAPSVVEAEGDLGVLERWFALGWSQ